MKDDFARQDATEERTEHSNRDDLRRAPKTDITAFSRDHRPRTYVTTARKVEKRPYNPDRSNASGDRREASGERRSFNPNFSRDNKPYNSERKPFDGERKSFERKPFDGERKPYNSERKPYSSDRKPFDGERKPYNSERKPYSSDRKPFDGERKPYNSDRKPFDGENKPYERKEYRNGESRSQGEWRFKPKYPPKKQFDRPQQYNSTNYPKFETQTDAEEIRLNRYIAMSGICSRREADELISAGAVSVDGVVVTEMGTKISPTAEVRLRDEIIRSEKKVYLVLNKPKGYVTSLEDPHAEKTVMDLVKGGCKERVYPVGRLDKNSLGVLLFTNDGDLAKQLTHPSYEKKKVYQVSLDKPITKADMERIIEGIELEDGEIHADEISWVGAQKSEVGIEIHSGRNRIVRRIFEHLGYSVRKLDRVYFAGLTKAKLKRGQWRFLSPKEVEILRSGRYE